MNILQSKKFLFFFALFLLAAKLWLVSSHYVMVRYAPHDDLLFATQAHNLLSGNWLGSYDQMTLIKGPFYPLFIALAYWLNIPLLTAQQLLYWLASYIAIMAVFPSVRRKWLLPLLFLFLLLNPFSYNYPVVGRLFRESVYPSLGMLVFSCYIGLHVRCGISWKNALAWSITAGLSLSAFWNTREESVWILPSLIILMLFGIMQCRQLNRPGAAALISLYVLPILILLSANYALKTINYRKYGVFATVELKTPEFNSAYGGMLRVRSDKWRQFFPVVKDVREKIYAVSPAFRQLQPYLEGSLGEGWRKLSATDDIPAAFFIWVLRDAVARAGYAKSGQNALQFYAQIGKEIDQACAAGKLDCQPRSIEFVPAWHREYNALLLPAFFSVLQEMITFKNFSAITSGMMSFGKSNVMIMCETVTRERLLPSSRHRLESYPDYHRHLDKEKTKILNDIGKGYKNIVLPVSLLALLIFLFSAGRIALKKRKCSLFTVASAAALAGVLSIAFILTVLKITSYSEIARALHSSYPMLLCFITTAFLDAASDDFFKNNDAAVSYNFPEKLGS